MEAVVIDPAPELIAERQRLGLDLFDEVWNGEYHMVPAPTGEHQRVVFDLGLELRAAARSAGLDLRHEFNVIAAGVPGWIDFRVPDLVVFAPAAYDERGIVGRPALVVEIRSPGDESFEKLPFYECVGAGEVLIIDRDTKVVRHWVLVRSRLVEQVVDPGSGHRLRCLPVTMRTESDQLIVEAEGGVTRI